MKFNDALIGLAVVVLAGVILWQASSFPPMPGQDVGPALFPTLIAVGLAVCAAALIWNGLRRLRSEPAIELSDWMRSPRLALNLLIVIAGVAFYIAFAERLGFLIAAPIVLTVLLITLGTRWWLALVVALAVSFAMHYIFYSFLKVPLPWGLLTEYAW
jgi:putative tricarboxylic transport membrane protein